MLTNVRSLWAQPRDRLTRDWAFRIHDGHRLEGRLVWGTGDYPANDVTLDGSYELSWHTYAALDVAHGTLRWLGVEVQESLQP